MTAPRPAATQAGFTLIEVLVTVVLLGLLTLVIAQGLHFAFLAWRTVQARSAQSEERDAATVAIRRVLEQAQAVYASADPADPTLDFAGTASAVTLIAPLPEAIDPGIMARQRLALMPAPHSTALSLSWQLDLPGTTDTAPPVTTVTLLDDVKSLRLRYWGAARPDAAAAWQDDWQGLAYLPGLIRMDIVTADNTETSIEVSPRATVSPACVYRPIGPVCQRP